MKTAKFATLGLSALIIGCDGGGSSDGPDNLPPPGPEPLVQSGVFLDAPVVNIGYRTETQDGITNEDGEYDYLSGETVTFFIGDLSFPTVNATDLVTPLEIAQADDITDPMVVNMIRLLQTLDQDGNPSNGITITDAAKEAATPVDFALLEDEFAASSAVTNLIANAGQSTSVTALVSKDAALAHFEEQLIDLGVVGSKIEGVWLATGRPQVHIGESDLGLLVLLENGDYWFAEANEINEGDGFEYGAYTYNNGTLSATTLVDTNSSIGFSSTNSAATLNIDLGLRTFTFETDDERERGYYTFTRQDVVSSGIVGVWSLADEPVLFVFLPNGEYVAYQHEEENDFVGYEWGEYTWANGTLSISTIDNSDGEALLCNEPIVVGCIDTNYGATVDADALTLVVPGEGPLTLSREL